MNNLFKTSLVTAAAILSLTFAGSVWALGPKTASTTAQFKANQIEKFKAKADTEIQRRLTTLNNILSKFGEAKKLTDADKALLTTQIQAEITNLTALKTKIDADTDIATLRTDVQSIVKDYRVYFLIVPKVHILIASDRILSLIDKMTAFSNSLQDKINQAKTAGNDVTTLQAALDDMKAKIADASTQAKAANTAVANLTPDQFNADHTILNPAKKDLNTAKTDLVAARKDAQTVISGLKLLKASPSASPKI